jgi:hypothetical protein
MATMKPRTGALFFLGTASAIIVACGDSKPEPKAPDSPVSSSSATDMPPEAPKAVASASAPPATTPPPAAEDAGAAPKSTNGVPLESKDECTPVGVDFEKRARPKLKECYAEGKKKEKNPNLEGTVKIKITVDVKGKIKATKVIEKTLPDSVANCMLKAVQATPFPEVDKCWDSTITIPITFPTPP